MTQRRIAILLCLAGAGCTSSDTDLIGRCELVTEAVRIVDEETEPVIWSQSVGSTASFHLVQWHSLRPSDSGTVAVVWLKWLAPDLRDATRSMEVGRSVETHPSRWAEVDGRLAGQLWADPDAPPDAPPAEPEDSVRLVLATPPPDNTLELQRVVLSTTRQGCSACTPITLGREAGQQGVLPVAVAGDRIWGGLVSRPPACGENYVNHNRLFLFNDRDGDASTVRWGDDMCPDVTSEYTVSVPYLFHLGGGDLGCVLRTGGFGIPRGPADGRVRLLRLDSNGRLTGGPFSIGKAETRAAPNEGGQQPRAVSLPEGRVLFSELRGRGNDCQGLRIVDDDGTGAHDAPWQLPCERDPSEWKTSSIELVEVPGAAVVVWAERTRYDGWLAASRPYVERVRAVLLTPEGRRGSEVITVTDDSATVLDDIERTESFGPYPRDFDIAAAGRGNDVLVSWGDRRDGRDTIFARRIRCTTDSLSRP